MAQAAADSVAYRGTEKAGRDVTEGLWVSNATVPIGTVKEPLPDGLVRDVVPALAQPLSDSLASFGLSRALCFSLFLACSTLLRLTLSVLLASFRPCV